MASRTVSIQLALEGDEDLALLRGALLAARSWPRRSGAAAGS
jgi:hypothetical protein